VPLPYRSSPVFDETTLPAALRREHRTKAGVWGVIELIEGRMKFIRHGHADATILEPGKPGLVLPEQPHFVEPIGPVRVQVHFYDQPPEIGET